MKRYSLLSLIVILALVMAACSPAAESTEEVPVTGATAEPTAMMEPTATMAPAATAVPTMAPTATEAATATAMPEAGETIVDIAVGNEQFSTLVAALQAAGLVETLQGEGPFTVFAPTNAAFEALPEGTVESLLQPENRQQLTDILTYHVVPGRVMAADVVGLSEAETVLGQTLNIRTEGENVFINDAQVIQTDIEASNGVIHVIDSVLLPAQESDAEAGMAEMDIVDTAVADGRFQTLTAALEAAGLVETLKGEGPFTVFAPTDEAFEALPEGTVETLLQPENSEQLTSILTYHVVSGRVMAEQVVTLDQAETIQGQPVQIRVENGNVYINDAQVIITDIETSNGVIHVIDSVLIPAE